MQKHRIHTDIGRDHKITVQISSTYDLMEILSLKFSQKDIYASGKCSDYGVVVGRVTANSGFGIPNAKVSIFVPLSEMDENDPVISALYPYKDINDKDVNGYRYNLLPQRKQHGGHAPTGTFMDQQDILTREECLEVFEKYYNYTVKTNDSGDFMIWGVPIGTQVLHIDIDLSDMGCFSLRPYDFIKKGYATDDFDRVYAFKSSSDIDSLPQIITFDKTIDVYPFWGNEELCEIGITRTDFDLSERNIKIDPVALILVSTITDDTNDAVKRNGRIKKKSGYKCNLQTIPGTVECVRFTGKSVIGSDGITEYPELEYLNITDTINDDGVVMIALPMNLDYIYTNEFGEQEITNDSSKGIPTSSIARFRFDLDFNTYKHATAKYLVPNIREFNPNNNGTSNGVLSDSALRYGVQYSEGMLATYTFSDVFEDYINVVPPISGMTLSDLNYDTDVKEHKKDLMLGTNNTLSPGSPEDYFYKFISNKVYTVSSFQGTHYETAKIRDAFLGIKEIQPNVEDDCASNTNYFPTNFAFKNRTKFTLLLSQVLLFIQFIFSVITVKFAEIIGRIAYSIGRTFLSINIMGAKVFPKVGQQLIDFSYRTQDKYTQQLPLTIYPDCEECTADDETLIQEWTSFSDRYCRIAEVKFKVNVTPIMVELSATVDQLQTSGSTEPGANFYSVSPNVFSSLLSVNVYDSFYGDSARQNTDLCSGTTEMHYTQLSDLHNITLPSSNEPRYGAEVYSWSSNVTGTTITGMTSFSSFSGYFKPINSNEPENIVILSLPMAAMYVYFSKEVWNELTGMDFIHNPELEDEIYDLYAVIRIYDRALVSEEFPITGETINVEVGCQKYDKLYNENIMFQYLWTNDPALGYNPSLPILPPNYSDDTGFNENRNMPSTHPYLVSTIIGTNSTRRLPFMHDFTRYSKRRNIGIQYYDRKTKSGLSEFRDGLFTIIPVIQGKSYNLKAIQEWYRRKRVGLTFCGGVINYSFIDNWIHGLLYFFKFHKRIRWDDENNYDLNQRGSKYPKELVFYNIREKEFYYRCCPYVYVNEQGIFTGQTYIHDGHNVQEILHPTTFFDLGVRDEFLSEICTEAIFDPTCSVVRDITSTSYQDPGGIVEHAINYRLDTTGAKFKVDDFFSNTHYGSNIKVFDGDVTQLLSINCETGIEAFDTDSPHYSMYNGEYMDPESPEFDNYFCFGSLFGPTPIDFKFDFNGKRIRLCLNYRLGDFTQIVPFYLWNKKGEGFGQYGNDSDKQTWDRTQIASMPLQRIFSISDVSGTTTNYLMADGEEEYLLKPMTITHNTFSMTGATEDMLERFEVISLEPPSDLNNTIGFIEGDLWLQVLTYSGSDYRKDPITGIIYVVVNKMWVPQFNNIYEDNYRENFIPQTALNYSGEKQVLSTPFLFYFGLRPGKTALDLLIKSFGDSDAFISDEFDECIISDIITPTPPPTPSISTPIPSISIPIPSASLPTPSSLPPDYVTVNILNNASSSLSISELWIDGEQQHPDPPSPDFPYYPGDSGVLMYYGGGRYTIVVVINGVYTIPSYLSLVDSSGDVINTTITNEASFPYSIVHYGRLVVSSAPVTISLNDGYQPVPSPTRTPSITVSRSSGAPPPSPTPTVTPTPTPISGYIYEVISYGCYDGTNCDPPSMETEYIINENPLDEGMYYKDGIEQKVYYIIKEESGFLNPKVTHISGFGYSSCNGACQELPD